MIEYRDKLALEWKLNMIFGSNFIALASKATFPDGNSTRIECCNNLKTEALKNTLNGTGIRFRMNYKSGKYERFLNQGAISWCDCGYKGR